MVNKTFRRLTRTALIMIYLVIVAGAVVRMTGSGMGCPDWPKCFGLWVPPTDVSKLPPNYQEIYSNRGYKDTSFNVFHTWTEYINRLIGALAGVVLIGLTAYSLKFRSTKPRLFWYCLAVLIAIGFQGWLGKVVVDSVLAPVKITIHMLMALILAALLIGILVYTQNGSTTTIKVPFKLRGLMIMVLLLTLVQVAFGTQVRQGVDAVALQLHYNQRETWIAQLGIIFKVHRSFSLLVIALNGYVYYLLSKSGLPYKLFNWVMALLLAEATTGVIMAYCSVPYFVQPIHLVLASIIFGVQFYLFLSLRKNFA